MSRYKEENEVNKTKISHSEIKSPDSRILSTVDSKKKQNRTTITSHSHRSKDDNQKDKSCFILFERSNIKKMKKEIEKHDRNFTAQDNSLLAQNSTMRNETLEEKRTTTKDNETKIDTTPKIKITEKNYEVKTQEQKGIY
jgi:hypothetical protein